MDLKQAIGWMLLLIMLITAYGLFGAGAIEKTPVQIELPKQNLSTTPEISAYRGVTMEEHITIDVGGIAVMAFLILITSLGSLPKIKILPEKGSKEELEELEGDEKYGRPV